MDRAPETVFKVVVTGPFAAGKTTFVETVVQRAFVTMGARTTSSEETGVKQATTIGMDFGVFTLEDPAGDVELRIYGTPGQDRFSFMWEVLAEGADGFVLVVNGLDPASWIAARSHHAVMERVGIPGVLAVNRGGQTAVEEARAYYEDLTIPVVGCEAIDPEDVKQVLIEALVTILAHLEPPDLGPDDVAHDDHLDHLERLEAMGDPGAFRDLALADLDGLDDHGAAR